VHCMQEEQRAERRAEIKKSRADISSLFIFLLIIIILIFFNVRIGTLLG